MALQTSYDTYKWLVHDLADLVWHEWLVCYLRMTCSWPCGPRLTRRSRSAGRVGWVRPLPPVSPPSLPPWSQPPTCPSRVHAQLRTGTSVDGCHHQRAPQQPLYSTMLRVKNGCKNLMRIMMTKPVIMPRLKVHYIVIFYLGPLFCYFVSGAYGRIVHFCCNCISDTQYYG